LGSIKAAVDFFFFLVAKQENFSERAKLFMQNSPMVFGYEIWA
jgi:hypothetical protein